MKKLFLVSAALILLAVIGYSSYQLFEIQRNTTQEAEVHRWLMQYHPLAQPPNPTKPSVEAPVPGSSGETADEVSPDEAPAPQIVNQSILDLQAGHPDVVGWLMVPNTRIDYPFVQGVDNDYYLHLDLNQRWSAAGTIFMDSRNGRALSDFHTILYGHHMQNGSMFGTLQRFDDRYFFDDNQTGTLFLPYATYEIEFLAFVVIPPNDTMIYNPTITTDADRIAFLDHVRSIARHYRDIGVTEHDRIITLSTCNYEFHNARMVLIGRLAEA